MLNTMDLSLCAVLFGFQRKRNVHVARAQDLLQLYLGQPLHLAEPGKAPGVFIVIDGDLIPLIQDEIARFCRDPLVVGGKGRAQGADLLEIGA